MNWRTFIVEIIKALSWPITAIVAVLLLRRILANLLLALRGIKYKDVELEFGKKLEELEVRAEQVNLPEAQEKPDWVHQDPNEWLLGEYVERVAPISPKVAIIEAWRHVELAIRDAAKKLTKEPPPRSLLAIVNLLTQEGSLPRNAVDLIADLRELRNRAVHANDFELTPEQAIEFGQLAERLIAALKMAETSVPE